VKTISAGLHLIVEEQLKTICARCRGDLEGVELRKQFWLGFEYLSTTCPHCEYEIFIPVGS